MGDTIIQQDVRTSDLSSVVPDGDKKTGIVGRERHVLSSSSHDTSVVGDLGGVETSAVDVLLNRRKIGNEDIRESTI